MLDDAGEAVDGLLLGLEHLVTVGVLGVVYDGLAMVGGNGVVVVDGAGEHGALAGDEPIWGNLGAAFGDIPKDVRREIGDNTPSDIVDFVFWHVDFGRKIYCTQSKKVRYLFKFLPIRQKIYAFHYIVY